MKIEVTTACGSVVSFESINAMFEFAKNYAVEHQILPKKIMIDNKVIDTAGRMIMCDMVYLVKTISGQVYCINRFEYDDFVEAVSRGNRKTPAGVLKLTDAGPGLLLPWTYIFDEDVQNYIRHILPRQQKSM